MLYVDYKYGHLLRALLELVLPKPMFRVPLLQGEQQNYPGKAPQLGKEMEI